jgi:YD repeat-containing protein
VTYAYDAAGNLTSATMQQASASLSYNTRNQLSNISRLNGVSSVFTYDPATELLAVAHTKGATAIDTESYSYDAAGNRIGHSTTTGQPLITQPTVNQYDVANRLIQFGPTVNTYDANGNLVQEGNTVAYTRDSRNRLKSIVIAAGQTTNFTYDLGVATLERRRSSGESAV